MKKILSLIVVMLFSVNLTVYAEGTLEIPAPSAILIEASSGKVLYEKDADTKRPPASVTKVMTMLLIMEKIDSGALKYTDTITSKQNHQCNQLD